MTGATTTSLQVAPPRRVFYALTALLASLVVGTRLAGLSASPPGLFRDEAAFGYNGWTIAHFGVDQYGTDWPLFFRSFGDYKGPVGVYLEAFLTSFLPLAPWVIRIPNAIAGAALAFAAGWLAWRLTRSRAVFLVLAASSTTARLSDVSVFKGHGLFGGLGLALVDYLQYLGPWLLFLHGDGNLRHSTGVEGLFMVATAVPLVVGTVIAFRRRADPIATIALLALLIAPAAASLAVGVNARRDVISMPFF